VVAVLKNITKYLLATAVLAATPASAKLNVVCTGQDLYAVAKEIAGDKVTLSYLAKGNQDLHSVQLKPSYITKLSKADVVIAYGMDMDEWVIPLIESSKNGKIVRGKDGFLDASEGISIIGKPGKKVTREEGDIHKYGNPHYWLGPSRMMVAAENIKDRLSKLDPDNEDSYAAGYTDFESELESDLIRWKSKIKSLGTVKIVTYHDSWPYFTSELGINIVEHLEPKPGIPPTPKHTKKVIGEIESNDVKIIIVEPFYETKTAKSVAKKTGAVVLILPSSVGGVEGVDTYNELIEYDVNKIYDAVKGG
jgi:zinc/manganese transport system substrate-binding protein